MNSSGTVLNEGSGISASRAKGRGRLCAALEKADFQAPDTLKSQDSFRDQSGIVNERDRSTLRRSFLGPCIRHLNQTDTRLYWSEVICELGVGLLQR